MDRTHDKSNYTFRSVNYRDGSILYGYECKYCNDMFAREVEDFQHERECPLYVQRHYKIFVNNRNEIIAQYLKGLGHRPSWSTGIHEGYTCGYGYIDELGYWEYPLWDDAIKADQEWEQTGILEYWGVI